MTLRAGRVIAFTTLLIMLSSPLLITSCSNVKRDGAPSFHVDATKVPNATPKLEPLSKFGNMSSYKVKGQRYYPRKSSQNFEQVGIASWYGTLFHDRKTSSGEPYDMLGMTAAHKTLPLPTYVEVTNLKNQRKIIVRVNDRGPFKHGRIIDLSFVAAKKLGMTGRGTAPVRIKAIDPIQYALKYRPLPDRHINPNKPKPQRIYAENTARAPVHSYQEMWRAKHHPQLAYLEVGQFRRLAQALTLKQELFKAAIQPIRISSRTSRHPYYRVQVGPIKSITMETRLLKQLKTLGMNANKVYGA